MNSTTSGFDTDSLSGCGENESLNDKVIRLSTVAGPVNEFRDAQ
jgi:hypothetical protein